MQYQIKADSFKPRSLSDAHPLSTRRQVWVVVGLDVHDDPQTLIVSASQPTTLELGNLAAMGYRKITCTLEQVR